MRRLVPWTGLTKTQFARNWFIVICFTTPEGVGGIGYRTASCRRSSKRSVAAVDEGILQVTEFETPSPLDYYFQRLRLGRFLFADGLIGRIHAVAERLGITDAVCRTASLEDGLIPAVERGLTVTRRLGLEPVAVGEPAAG